MVDCGGLLSRCLGLYRDPGFESLPLRHCLAEARLRRDAEKTDDPTAQTLLRRLAEMEESNYEIRQAELDYINKTGFWMGFKEVPFEAE